VVTSPSGNFWVSDKVPAVPTTTTSAVAQAKVNRVGGQFMCGVAHGLSVAD